MLDVARLRPDRRAAVARHGLRPRWAPADRSGAEPPSDGRPISPVPGRRPRPGAGQDQPGPEGRARRAPTASTRWPPSTRRCRCSTRCYAAWADPDEFSVTVTGEGADQVPTDDRNLAVRAARLLADRYGDGPAARGRACRSTRPSRSPAGWPAARPTARRRCSPARTCGTSTSSLDQMRSAGRRCWAATCRSPCSAVPRWAAAGASRWRRRSPAARTTGSSASASTACPRRRSTGRSTSSAPTRRPPEVPDELMDALRAGDPVAARRGAGQRPAGRGAATCSPSCAGPWRPDSSTARWERSCRVRDRPARSWRSRRRPRSTCVWP